MHTQRGALMAAALAGLLIVGVAAFALQPSLLGGVSTASVYYAGSTGAYVVSAPAS